MSWSATRSRRSSRNSDPVFVGVLRLTFHVPHARSLKDKRRVILKFRDRIRSRFDVSVAEVDAQDKLQRAVFGVSVVSSDAAVCDSVPRRRRTRC